MNNYWENLELLTKIGAFEGLVVEVSTEYAPVSGILVEVLSDYIVLRSKNHLIYVPVSRIKSLINLP